MIDEHEGGFVDRDGMPAGVVQVDVGEVATSGRGSAGNGIAPGDNDRTLGDATGGGIMHVHDVDGMGGGGGEEHTKHLGAGDGFHGRWGFYFLVLPGRG